MTLAKTTPALITCSACGSQMSLDVAIAHIGARAAVRRCLESMGEVGLGLMSYIALHRSRARQLTWEKSAKLLDEVLSMIDRGWIERNHDRHAVNAALWIAAFAEVKDASTKTLTLPLDGHGYLLQVLASLATKAHNAKDREQEAIARGETPVGRSAAHVGVLLVKKETSSATLDRPEAEPVVDRSVDMLAAIGKLKMGRVAPVVDPDRTPAPTINPREGAKPKAVTPSFALVDNRKQLVEIVSRKGQKVTVKLLEAAEGFENVTVISVKDLL